MARTEYSSLRNQISTVRKISGSSRLGAWLGWERTSQIEHAAWEGVPFGQGRVRAAGVERDHKRRVGAPRRRIVDAQPSTD